MNHILFWVSCQPRSDLQMKVYSVPFLFRQDNDKEMVSYPIGVTDRLRLSRSNA